MDPATNESTVFAINSRLKAMSRVASVLGESESVAETGYAVAEEVRNSVGLAAVHLRITRAGFDSSVGAVAGFPGSAEELWARLMRCRTLGAELVSQTVIEQRRPVVVTRRWEKFHGDPAWEPLLPTHRTIRWKNFAAVPVLLHNKVVGYLSAFYPSEREPEPDGLHYLCALADQAASTIDHAVMIAESRDRAAAYERQRLACDLHDSILQEVFSLSMHARAIGLAAEAPDDEAIAKIRSDAARVANLSHSVMKSLRSVISELRSPQCRSDSLIAAIREWVSTTAAGVMAVKVVDEVGDLRLSPQQSREVWYVVREAVHNALKHAGARQVVVRFRERGDSDGDHLVVEVSDDGVGFTVSRERPGQLGLISMSRRAERLGGRLTIATAPGRGTRVVLDFRRESPYVPDPVPDAPDIEWRDRGSPESEER